MAETNRITVPYMESIMNQQWPVLDHGFVTLKDYMGNDTAIVEAARESTSANSKGEQADKNLARFLMRREHTSPFEMCEIKLECGMPIFVARDWVRHRTANINEFSARMAQLIRKLYIPAVEHVHLQSSLEKQGGSGSVDPEIAKEFLRRLEEEGNRDYDLYEWAISNNIAYEQSRMAIPVNIYTKWVWKIDLHNLLHFLFLRNHPAAQWEFQQYAKTIEDIVAQWVPVAYQAYLDFKKNAYSLSAPALTVIKSLLHSDEKITMDDSMTPREWRELIRVFDIEERITR